MHDILNVRNIETTSSNIGANEDSTLSTSLSIFNSLYTTFEAIKTLQTSFLLHLGVETVVLDLEEA
jgi:hypothetical protein